MSKPYPFTLCFQALIAASRTTHLLSELQSLCAVLSVNISEKAAKSQKRSVAGLKCLMTCLYQGSFGKQAGCMKEWDEGGCLQLARCRQCFQYMGP